MALFHKDFHKRLAKHIKELDKFGKLPEMWVWYHDKVIELKEIDDALIEDLNALHSELGESPETLGLLEKLQEELGKMLNQQPVGVVQERKAKVVNNLIKQIKVKVERISEAAAIIGREKTTGKELQSGVWKKVYEDNLDLIYNPIVKHAKNYFRGLSSISIGDIGGATGIVGEAIRKALEKAGYKSTLMVIDVNPKQLEVDKARGVRAIKMNLFDPRLSSKPRFNVVTTRNVIHYITKKEEKRAALKVIYNCLLERGVYVINELTARNSTEQMFMNKYMNELETSIRKSKVEKYIAAPGELVAWLKEAGFKQVEQISLLKVRFTPSDFERFKLNDEAINRLRNIVLNADRQVKEGLNVRDIREHGGNVEWDFYYTVISAVK